MVMTYPCLQWVQWCLQQSRPYPPIPIPPSLSPTSVPIPTPISVVPVPVPLSLSSYPCLAQFPCPGSCRSVIPVFVSLSLSICLFPCLSFPLLLSYPPCPCPSLRNGELNEYGGRFNWTLIILQCHMTVSRATSLCHTLYCWTQIYICTLHQW